MAVQNYIGWPIGVNRVILDSTTITVGENALQQDELENGRKTSILKSSFIPEKFAVKMSFNWYDVVGTTGKTEYQLFTEWYKYKHKCGVIPFEFPNILYSSESGIKVKDEPSDSIRSVQYYKITSSTEGSKSGYDISITMTWESVYSGTVSITTPEPMVLDIAAHSKFLDVVFSDVSDTAPTLSHFKVYRKPTQNDSYSEVTVTGFVFDGSYTVRLYYDEIQSGIFSIAIDDYSGLTEAVGTHTSQL